jgi:hypothetical protein
MTHEFWFLTIIEILGYPSFGPRRALSMCVSILVNNIPLLLLLLFFGRKLGWMKLTQTFSQYSSSVYFQLDLKSVARHEGTIASGIDAVSFLKWSVGWKSSTSLHSVPWREGCNEGYCIGDL